MKKTIRKFLRRDARVKAEAFNEAADIMEDLADNMDQQIRFMPPTVRILEREKRQAYMSAAHMFREKATAHYRYVNYGKLFYVGGQNEKDRR